MKETDLSTNIRAGVTSTLTPLENVWSNDQQMQEIRVNTRYLYRQPAMQQLFLEL